MSSRSGPRAAGSDGQDFKHRQRILAHYRDSVVHKSRIRVALGLHSFLLVGIFVKLLEEVLDYFRIDWAPLERLNFPDAQFWEIWWATSVVPVVLGFMACPRNNEVVMRWCYYGLFCQGLLPIALGAGALLPNLLKFVRDPDFVPTLFLNRFPMIVLWFMFFAICLQLHSFTMYSALQLVKAWRPLQPQKPPLPPGAVQNGPEASHPHVE